MNIHILRCFIFVIACLFFIRPPLLVQAQEDNKIQVYNDTESPVQVIWISSETMIEFPSEILDPGQQTGYYADRLCIVSNPLESKPHKREQYNYKLTTEDPKRTIPLSEIVQENNKVFVVSSKRVCTIL